MTTSEYAEYVIRNIDRAAVTNAFNIAKKYYKTDPIEFLHAIAECGLSTKYAHQIAVLCSQAETDLQTMAKIAVLDEFVLELWEIFHDNKSAQTENIE